MPFPVLIFQGSPLDKSRSLSITLGARRMRMSQAVPVPALGKADAQSQSSGKDIFNAHTCFALEPAAGTCLTMLQNSGTN